MQALPWDWRHDAAWVVVEMAPLWDAGLLARRAEPQPRHKNDPSVNLGPGTNTHVGREELRQTEGPAEQYNLRGGQLGVHLRRPTPAGRHCGYS